jgi:hypothetical protein
MSNVGHRAAVMKMMMVVVVRSFRVIRNDDRPVPDCRGMGDEEPPNADAGAIQEEEEG